MERGRHNKIKRAVELQKLNGVSKTENLDSIYCRESLKTKNTRIYKDLNSGMSDNNSNNPKHDSSDNLKVDKMLKAYNKSKKRIIDFKKEKVKENEKIEKDEKQIEKTSDSKTREKQPKNNFKDSIKVEPKKISEMDKIIYEFEKALKERKEYEKELKAKGAKEFKAYRRSDCEKDL